MVIMDAKKGIKDLRLLARFFYKKLVRWMHWPSSTRGLSQIWLQVRGKTRLFFKSPYILATCKNLWSKYGEFNFILLENMATLGHFIPKKTVIQVAVPPLFGGCQVAKFCHKKKKPG
jgi:hypothetical protein